MAQEMKINEYEICVNSDRDIFSNINRQLRGELDRFKRVNQISNGRFKRGEPEGNNIQVTLILREHYDTRFVEVGKLQARLRALNKYEDYAQISEITHGQEGCDVDFEFVRLYNIRVT